MPLDLLNTIASLGTFVVITATAIAAVVQLRHLGKGNQLNAILALNAERHSADVDEAFAFVDAELHQKLADPAFRAELQGERTPNRAVHKELNLADYYERVGIYVRLGVISEALYFSMGNPTRYWKLVEPAIAIYRRRRGPQAFDNFEYLVLREREWERRNPDGAFRKGQARLELADPYRLLDGAATDEGRARAETAVAGAVGATGKRP